MKRDNAMQLLFVSIFIILNLSLIGTAQLRIEEWFFTSGWFGEVQDIGLTQAWTDNPYSGPVCIQIIYQPSKENGASGIYWQYPKSNWGESRGMDLRNYNRVRFYARGNGNNVEFRAGGIQKDTVNKSIWKKLTTTWEAYEINLSGKNLENVAGGFCVKLSEENNSIGGTYTIYLDDIVYERI